MRMGMRARWTTVVVGAALLWAAIPAAPGQAAGKGKPSAKDVLEASSLRAQMDFLAVAVPATLETAPLFEDLPEDQRRAVRQALDAAFSAKGLAAAAEQSIQRTPELQRFPAASKWLKTPVGKKVMAMERAAFDPAKAKEREEFAARLGENAAPKDRQVLVQRLEAATDHAEFMTSALTTTLLNMVRAAAEAQPRGPRFSDDELQRLGVQLRRKVEDNLKVQTRALFLYTFRDASDAELNQYLDWLASPAGRWFTQLSKDAILDALVAAGGQAGRKLPADALAKQRTAKP